MEISSYFKHSNVKIKRLKCLAWSLHKHYIMNYQMRVNFLRSDVLRAACGGHYLALTCRKKAFSGYTFAQYFEV